MNKIILILLITNVIFAMDKIPKEKINSYNYIKDDDISEKWQVSIFAGHQFLYWDNKKDVILELYPKKLNNVNIQFSIERYFMFYHAITFRLSYLQCYNQIYLASGYKLNLYKAINLKTELITQFYNSRFNDDLGESINWDIGPSVSLGMEFYSFDRFKIIFYPIILNMLIINNRNITSFQWESYFGLAYYF